MSKNLITSIIGTQLKFDLQDLSEGSTITETIDFTQVLDLLGDIEKDPAGTVSTILKIKIGLDRIYLHYRDKQRELQLELDHFEHTKQELYSRQDSTNPLYGEAKLTVAVKEAKIKSDPEYVRRNAEIEVYNSYKSHVYALKEVMSDTISLAQALIGAPHLYVSGSVDPVDKQDASDMADRILRLSKES